MVPLSQLLEKVSVFHHYYADDVFVYVSFSSTTVIENIKSLETALNTISDWMSDNCLSLNPNKTHCHLFSNKRSTVPNFPTIHLRDIPLVIHKEDSFRCLGVQLDSNLEMSEFVSSTCRSAFLQTRMLAHARKCLPLGMVKLLSQSLILSRIDFCVSLLSCSTKNNNIKRLQRVINHAARVVMQRSDKHITPILQSLEWHDVEKRILKKKIVFIFNTISGKSPDYLKEMVEAYVPNRSLRSQSSHLLKPFYPKKKIGAMSFRYWAAATWNALEEDIRKSGSLEKVLTQLEL
jgi:hypothetical protein